MEKEIKKAPVDWAVLLENAVKEPGKILEAYSTFHGYSIGNQFAALFQCKARNIQPGPIATFRKWKELERNVKAGSKAIALCQPILVKDRTSDNPEDKFQLFLWKNNWFVLAQTDGKELDADAFKNPVWDKNKALANLSVQEEEFQHTDGNIQGYATRNRTIAINPLAAIPLKTLFHELGHIVLNHVEADMSQDTELLPRNIKEVEAESVALICLESLELPGSEYCRGYIQSWYGAGKEITEKHAQRIFGAADKILKAGTQEKS